MLEKLKKRWKEFVKDEPGRRFQDRYERAHKHKRGIAHRVGVVSLGTMIFLAGLFFLPAPGPGMLIVLIGAGMLAQESLAIAKLLDNGEVRARRVAAWAKRVWRKMSARTRASLMALSAATIVALAYVSYRILLR